MDFLPGPEWIAACAHRLHKHWHSVDPTLLEEVAGDLWNNETLRSMPPAEAARAWLEPVEPRDPQ